MNSTSRPARLYGLDTLRALAIVLVTLHHYTLFVSGAPTFGWLGEIGWVGVDLFFALSGYLIGHQIFAAMQSGAGLSLGRFYGRRLLRTLPNFYVVLAMYAWLPGFAHGLDLPPLWEFLTFTQNINLAPGTAFSHAWSLCIEEQFYLLLPAAALAIAARRHSLRWAWAAIVLVFLTGLVARGVLWNSAVEDSELGLNHYYKYIYYSTFCRFDELVAGVALALCRHYHPAAWRRLTARGNVALLAGLVVTGLAWAWFLHDHFGEGVTVLGYPMLALGFSLLIVAALSEHSLLRRVRIPGAQRLALWSYAIYLLHKQICILLADPLAAAGYPAGGLPAVAVSLAASVLTGYCLFALVETPFMKLRERWLPLSPATPASSAAGPRSRRRAPASRRETPAGRRRAG